uniref:Putative secreted protein n=1 Tax=Anopheles triannulatus TaxID=58253 RepID=A0A2M4B0N3_9DIPT
MLTPQFSSFRASFVAIIVTDDVAAAAAASSIVSNGFCSSSKTPLAWAAPLRSTNGVAFSPSSTRCCSRRRSSASWPCSVGPSATVIVAGGGG